VLVVDDNADTLRLLQRYLTGSRYRFIGTRDPQEALTLAAETYDVRIRVLAEPNTKSLSGVDPARMVARSHALAPISRTVMRRAAEGKLRWTLTLFPTQAYAQDAEMSLAEYEDFVYGAILRDWEEERVRMRKLAEFMNKAEAVRIIGEGTDLTMSIKGRTAVVGDVTHNVPGGEVFTAPLDDSTEGEIYFDFPAIRYGKEVLGVRLKFHRGELVGYSAEKNEGLLKSMVETDLGARRLGELGIGTNYGIDRFTKNILFDEKIGGTIHLALGRAYLECGGVNKSAIHWDFIKSLKPGQLLVDGEVILRDGKLRF
jgi:aminopeptidase